MSSVIGARIIAFRIDVIVLIEAGLQWESELERLQAAYPYSARKIEVTPFSLAVLSRLKPISAAVVEVPDGYRHTEVRLVFPGHERVVAVYGVHPPPPISASLAAARNDNLARLARAIGERTDESAIVVGDFNLTPYSPYFKRFVNEGGLLPARCCLLHQSTWPVLFGSAWFGIPIDHSFVAPGLRAVSREVGPHLGSDHFPVMLTVQLSAGE